MTRRRWIADEVHGDTALLTGEHAAHLSRVLRAQIGQEFDIAVGDGVRHGRITSIADDRVEFALGPAIVTNPAINLTLALAIFKFDRMEWAIEKCTEIGVARIVPIIAERTDVHLASAAPKRCERWKRVARQAAEQSRRRDSPEITSPMKLRDLWKADVPPACATTALRIVLAEAEHEAQLRQVLQSHRGEIVLAVGPEGGWTDDEVRWFGQSGWRAASLGNNILRAETAAIVATALVLDAMR